MNHCFACRKDASGEPPCKQWCGRSDLCLSTLTYHEDYMQTAYERGHREALEKAAQVCDQLAHSTSPHRRMAGKDMAEAIRKITPARRGVLAADANDEDPHVMSALNSGVPRADAIQEAIAAGKQARDDGKPRTANPYKRDGERTLWHPWDIGWCRTQAEEDAALGVTVLDGKVFGTKDAHGS